MATASAAGDGISVPGHTAAEGQVAADGPSVRAGPSVNVEEISVHVADGNGPGAAPSLRSRAERETDNTERRRMLRAGSTRADAEKLSKARPNGGKKVPKDVLENRAPPGPEDKKILELSRIQEEFFIPFSELKWVSNLSEGAMGEVHRVQWRGIDCAVKRIKGKRKNQVDASLYQDMIGEMYVMSRIGLHPNIISLYGVCAGPQNDPVIIMELTLGPSLENFLQSVEGNLAHWRKQRATHCLWVVGVLRGLAFLHDRDPIILHRDMKPGNILIADNLKTVKIVDFGVSRTLRNCDRLKRSLTGMTGTRRYMAPEVYAVKRGKYTEKADVYSCCIVMWEMATGVKPFRTVPVQELSKPEVRYKLRPPLEMLEWKEFGAWLAKGWDVDPEARPTASEMLTEFENLAGQPDLSGHDGSERPSRTRSVGALDVSVHLAREPPIDDRLKCKCAIM